jgi:hypothetical protein
MTERPSIEDALAEASAWADMDGVVSVGQSQKDGADCLLVLVSDPEAGRRLPGTFKGFPVVVEASEPIAAQRRP